MNIGNIRLKINEVDYGCRFEEELSVIGSIVKLFENSMPLARSLGKEIIQKLLVYLMNYQNEPMNLKRSHGTELFNRILENDSYNTVEKYSLNSETLVEFALFEGNLFKLPSLTPIPEHIKNFLCGFDECGNELKDNVRAEINSALNELIRDSELIEKFIKNNITNSKNNNIDEPIDQNALSKTNSVNNEMNDFIEQDETITQYKLDKKFSSKCIKFSVDESIVQLLESCSLLANDKGKKILLNLIFYKINCEKIFSDNGSENIIITIMKLLQTNNTIDGIDLTIEELKLFIFSRSFIDFLCGRSSALYRGKPFNYIFFDDTVKNKVKNIVCELAYENGGVEGEIFKYLEKNCVINSDDLYVYELNKGNLINEYLQNFFRRYNVANSNRLTLEDLLANNKTMFVFYADIADNTKIKFKGTVELISKLIDEFIPLKIKVDEQNFDEYARAIAQLTGLRDLILKKHFGAKSIVPQKSPNATKARHSVPLRLPSERNDSSTTHTKAKLTSTSEPTSLRKIGKGRPMQPLPSDLMEQQNSQSEQTLPNKNVDKIVSQPIHLPRTRQQNIGRQTQLASLPEGIELNSLNSSQTESYFDKDVKAQTPPKHVPEDSVEAAYKGKNNSISPQPQQDPEKKQVKINFNKFLFNTWVKISSYEIYFSSLKRLKITCEEYSVILMSKLDSDDKEDFKEWLLSTFSPQKNLKYLEKEVDLIKAEDIFCEIIEKFDFLAAAYVRTTKKSEIADLINDSMDVKS